MSAHFPFPKLLKFLESESDQVEFMTVAAEVGVGAGDIEIAKLLLALQIYKAYYASIPRQIKLMHDEALAEFNRLRSTVKFEADRAAFDAAEVVRWAEQIKKEVTAVSPEALVKVLHKRLLDETVTMLGGTLNAMSTSYKQIEAATRAMDEAGYRAALAIESFDTVTLRRVWLCAFAVCGAGSVLAVAAICFFYLSH